METPCRILLAPPPVLSSPLLPLGSLIGSLTSNGLEVVMFRQDYRPEWGHYETLKLIPDPNPFHVSSKKQAIGTSLLIPFRSWLKQRRLSRLIAHHAIHVMMAVSRTDMYAPRAVNILVTLGLLDSEGSQLEENTICLQNRHISRYRQWWISDPLMAGSPAQKAVGNRKNVPVIDIGVIRDIREWKADPGVLDYSVCLWLTGSHKADELLENTLLVQVAGLPGHVAYLRESASNEGMLHSAGKVHIFENLRPEAIQHVLERSGLVVCRPDPGQLLFLAGSGLPVVVVPRPGDAIQQRLATRLASASYALLADQQALDLRDALRMAASLQGIPGIYGAGRLESAIRGLAELIKNDHLCALSEQQDP